MAAPRAERPLWPSCTSAYKVHGTSRITDDSEGQRRLTDWSRGRVRSFPYPDLSYYLGPLARRLYSTLFRGTDRDNGTASTLRGISLPLPFVSSYDRFRTEPREISLDRENIQTPTTEVLRAWTRFPRYTLRVDCTLASIVPSEQRTIHLEKLFCRRRNCKVGFFDSLKLEHEYRVPLLYSQRIITNVQDHRVTPTDRSLHRAICRLFDPNSRHVPFEKQSAAISNTRYP